MGPLVHYARRGALLAYHAIYYPLTTPSQYDNMPLATQCGL